MAYKALPLNRVEADVIHVVEPPTPAGQCNPDVVHAGTKGIVDVLAGDRVDL